VTEHLDLPYREIEGVDPNLLSLDLYEPEPAGDCGPAPIVVWVHGGGFQRGDKSHNVDEKVALFSSAGWLTASVNYRLSPDPPDPDDPDRVTYPTHQQDVAAALAWLRDNAAEYGGDPARLLLLGHSAGAMLVSQLSTDESFLETEDMALDDLTCTASLDTNDELAERSTRNPGLVNAFGNDPGVLEQATPLTHVSPGRGIPGFLVVTRGNEARVAENQEFADALVAADVPAELLNAEPYSHEQVNSAVGDPDDEIVTPALMDFYRSCLGRSRGPSPMPSPGDSGGPGGGEAPSAPSSLAALDFDVDYPVGTTNADGDYLGGTETSLLTTHDGALYAGMGYWKDEPGADPAPGAQVLVKESPESGWSVDLALGPEFESVEALTPITFTTDWRGHPLPDPVTLRWPAPRSGPATTEGSGGAAATPTVGGRP
jgi:acetyl esterase/lipase